MRWSFLGGVVVLLLASVSLFYFGFVKVKMLPFDNKSEFQVIVDMPNGTTLEETARVTQLLAEETQKQREVVNVETYAGTASPYNFNGLVRHYYLRRGPNVADIQVNLLPKRRARPAEPRDRQAGARSVLSPSPSATARASKWPKCRPALRCSKRWWRKCTGPTWMAGSRWRDKCAICSSAPMAWWTWIGTWRTIRRSTA